MKRKVSLANKYRPKEFEDMVGQDSIKAILTNQVKTNNIKHAYLFTGPAGIGKTTSCRIIARMMNNGEANPIELDCASNNSVDDVRKIIDQCRTRPLKGKYKIFLLDEVHVLSFNAWNAMLKILEEPPEYIIFLLATTDPQKIPGTILSRVQRFNFTKLSVKQITDRLIYIINNENKEYFEETGLDENEVLKRQNMKLNNIPYITYEKGAVEYIARLAKGGMRDSITNLEKCLDYSTSLTLQNVLKITSNGLTEDSMLELLKYTLNKQCKEALLHFNNIYMLGIDPSLFLKLYTEFLENCVKYLITQDPNIVVLSDITINWLRDKISFTEELRYQLLEVLNIKNNFAAEDLKILIESWIMQICK